MKIFTNEAHARNEAVLAWVDEAAGLCRPDRIYWCNGSEEEKERLTKESLASGELEELDQTKWPGCYYSRSDINDVARTEQLTFICTRDKEDAGITNNWMDPREAYQKLGEIFRDSMRGRTLYVVPFLMGPPGSPFRKIGIQITDSRYVVLNMGIMARMGNIALNDLGTSDDFTKCLHGKADLNPKRRFICHFPEDNTIWSVGSAYGGNALLGKKCLALRIGSYLGKRQGWMAEHMLLMGVENPQGKVRYVVAAFPSQCGKTNLSMLIPPETLPGYRVWTLGDDISWLHIEPDGRLYAQNPENGFFGVAPGTNYDTNPNAMETIKRNTIFTNVLKTDDGGVWWEEMSPPPPHGINWAGKEWTPESKEYGSHPNARFTSPVSQCPSISPHWEDPRGVPVSAILFGARRATVAPLICESRNWQHGVYLGATMASETTAAAVGQTGVIRRDPMAMLPFIGYNVGDYFQHWLDMGKRLRGKAPKIFHVNWFRRDRHTGEFLWPGFGENLRAILWALDRCEGKGKAVDTPMGLTPTPDAINLSGLDPAPEKIEQVLEVRAEDWAEDLKNQREFFDRIGNRLPPELRKEQDEFARRSGL
jgi:phosphoenolpyruvate carboxykinase (GTP)